MKVAFPYFGYDTIALKNFIETLGGEVQLPPPTTERTLSIGTKYSPELICLPFKITLGNFIEALDNGADTLFMAAGARKCRFGYYHYIQETILKKIANGLAPHLSSECVGLEQNGCNEKNKRSSIGAGFKFYPISQYTPFEFIFQKMPEIFSVKPYRVIYAIYLLLQYSALVDEFRKLVRRARVVDFRRASEIEKRALQVIEDAKTINQIRNAKKEINALFDFAKKLPENTITVGLVGEIYLMLEPFANHDIEKELSKMGVLVVSKRSLYRHIKHLLHIDRDSYKIRRAAHKYLKDSPGGEAINTVGEARSFINQGVDGIIQLFPFTCMPENIALEALQKMSEDYSVPVLSLSIDEHTSKTGLLTRLEAFIDILKRVVSQRAGSRTPRSSLLTPR